MKKVMCKNNSLTGAHALQLGGTYNVLDETDTHYNIRSVRGHHDWYKKENFDIVEGPQIMSKGRKYNAYTKDSLGFYTVEGSQVVKYVGTGIKNLTTGKNYNVKDHDSTSYDLINDVGERATVSSQFFTNPSTVTGEDYKALDVLRTPSCLMVDEALATEYLHPKSKMAEKHPHYYANVKNLEFIDVYDVIELFGVKNACLQHVLKKIMVIGNRGYKNHDTDLQDIYDTLDRYKIMRGELHTTGV